MAPDNERKVSRTRVNLADVPDTWDREVRQRLAYLYLVRLDMLPVPFRRKRGHYENWLGFALFLPSYLFVMWKLLTG